MERVQGIRQGLQSWKSKNKTPKFQRKVWIGFQNTCQFKSFQHCQSHPGASLKLTGSFASPLAPRNARYHSHGLLYFLKSITSILALLAHLIDIFVIFDMFSSWLNSLIAFLKPIFVLAIVRISTCVLGFLATGKIRPWIKYHDDRDIITSWTLAFNFIYLAFCEFLSCTGL